MIKPLRWLRMAAILAVLLTGMGYAIALVAVNTFHAIDEVVSSVDYVDLYYAEAWNGFALIPLPALAIASAALAVVAVMELTLRSWRHTRVFVSYQHDYEPLAVELQQALMSSGFSVQMLAFDVREHDDTIVEVHSLLRRCQLVVAIPGPQQSWMDGEIHMASIGRKGIFIIDHLPDQRSLPGAFEGYPTFTLDCLRESEFVPLTDFVRLARNTPSTVITNLASAVGLGWATASIFVVASAVLGLGSFVLSIPVGLIRGGFGAVAQGIMVRLNILGWWLLVGVIVLPILFIAVEIYQRIYAASVLRQTILTGRFTAERLVESGLGEYVRCMPGGAEALARAEDKSEAP